MLTLRLIVVILPLALPAALADIGARGLYVNHRISGLKMTMRLAGTTASQAKRIADKNTGAKLQRDFAPRFAMRRGLLATLKRSRTMPVIQVIESRDKNLFLGISRDGTVGIHYRFRRSP